MLKERFLRPSSSQADPCPGLVEAYTHSLSGVAVPYRLAQATYGVGVFALRQVRKGELVWRYNPNEMVRLTEGNWRQVVEQLIRKRLWQDAPQLDEAFEKLAIQSRDVGEIPEEMLRLYLRKAQNYLVRYSSKDGETDYVLLLVGDSNYFNYAKHVGDRDASLLQLAGPGLLAGVADAQAPEATLIDKEPMFALRDIQPCEELLEDYDWSGDGDSIPTWMMRVLRKHGGVTFDFDKEDSDTTDNVG